MLRARFFHREFKVCLLLSRSYLSKEYKSVANKDLAPPFAHTELLPLRARKDAAALNVDSFITSLKTDEDRRLDICEQVLKLRSEADTSNAFGSTSFAVIKHFVDTDDIQQLLSILRDRLNYGIFIDKYLGCYLMDELIQKQDFNAAAQVASELLLQEDVDSELVVALSTKSFYEHFKTIASKPPEPSTEAASAEDDKQPETKVRVGFLRNPLEKITDKNYLLGKDVLKLAANSGTELKCDLKALGHLLCSQRESFIEIIKNESQLLYPDVLSLGQTFIKNWVSDAEAQEELLNAVVQQLAKQTTQRITFDEKLNQLVKDVVQKEEPKLIEQQKQNFLKWDQERGDKLKFLLERHSREQRESKIENIMTEMQVKKQKFQVFKNEDQIDLQIFNKRVFHRKRWFGKKKTPRAVDDNYVPPEITKQRN